MSALFDSGSGVIIHPSTIPRTLELRHVPFVQTNTEYLPKIDIDKGLFPESGFRFDRDIEELLKDAFYNSKADWMYTAIIQTALGGPEPAWSKDDWNFVPLNLAPEDSVSSNLTVHTPAIRARIDCSTIESTQNVSSWLKQRKGQPNYILNITGLDNYYSLGTSIFEGNLSTRVTAQGNYLLCCANKTEVEGQRESYAPSAVAYWTENWADLGIHARNFTIKWIRGPASFARILKIRGVDVMMFPEPPKIQALNCIPSFESSEAEVIVDPVSGAVHEYRILHTPLVDDVAWSDTFQYHQPTNTSGPDKDESKFRDYLIDVTTRYVKLHLPCAHPNVTVAMELYS
jgi:hypothetical protein